MRVKIFSVWVNSSGRCNLRTQNEEINDFCAEVEKNGGRILNISSEFINPEKCEIAIIIVYREGKG